jgi:hypothetical protein
MQISHTIAPMIKPDFVIAFLIFFIKIRIICLHSSVKEDLGPLSGDLGVPGGWGSTPEKLIRGTSQTFC